MPYSEGMNEQILIACTLMGSQTSLAKALGVKPPVVNQWLNLIRPVPPKTCVAIEKVTNGKVRRQDLRPNDFWELWPDLPAPVVTPTPTPPIPEDCKAAYPLLKNCGRFKDERAIAYFLNLPPVVRTEIFNTTPPNQLISEAMCLKAKPAQTRAGL